MSAVTVMAPPVAPSATGVKVTVALHAAPAASEAQACDTAKPGETEIAFTVTGVGSVLVSVITRPGEVVFIDWPPKSSDAGFAEMAPAVVLKMAVTDFAEFIVSWHAPEMLVQAPL